MNEIKSYDYIQPTDIQGKIILTCFPGRAGEKISFDENIFLDDLKNFNSLNCNTIVTLVEDSEFEILDSSQEGDVYSYRIKMKREKSVNEVQNLFEFMGENIDHIYEFQKKQLNADEYFRLINE